MSTRILIVLMLLSGVSFSKEFNVADSLSKLKSAGEADYIPMVSRISEHYLKEKKYTEAEQFFAEQVSINRNNKTLSDQLGLLSAKIKYSQQDYKGTLAVVDSIWRDSSRLSPIAIIMVWRLRGQTWFRMQDFLNSLNAFERAYQVAAKENIKSETGDLLVNMAVDYQAIGDLPQAMDYALKAKKISDEIKDTDNQPNILNLLGVLSLALGDREEAKDFFNQGLAVAKKIDDIEGLALMYGHLSTLERDAGNYEGARKLLSNALEYARKKNKHLVSGMYINLANLAWDEGNAAETKRYYGEAAKIAKEEKDHKNFAMATANLGFFITEEDKDYKKSNEYLLEAVGPAKLANDLPLVKEIMGGFYDNYKALNMPKEALHYYELYTAYSDSLLSKEKVKQINRLKTKYALDEKEKELNAKADIDKAVAAAEIKKQKLLRNFSIAGVLLLLVFAGFIFQRYRERNRTSMLLSEKNRTIEKAYNELKETQEELVETEKQREAQSIRVRIARDIHDDIGSGLTKITMLSDVLRKKMPQGEVTEALSRITSFSKGVSSSLSEIVWAINPGHDNVSSLVAYMKTIAGNLLEDSAVNYQLNFPNKEITTPIHPEIKRNIYLVMKEAINNVLKYASAKNITIEFSIDGNRFRLLVSDDGKGFDPVSKSESGNGLRNMANRMEQHYNTLQIISSPGHGCKIIAEGKLA